MKSVGFRPASVFSHVPDRLKRQGGPRPSAFANGIGGSGTSGWNTASYPAQSSNPGSAGVAFFAPTKGVKDIELQFAHRASGTASRWAQIDDTLDSGASWNTGFWNNGGGLAPQDTFYGFTVSLSAITGASDSAASGFRIVSIYSPVAFADGLGSDFAANAAYHRARILEGSVYGTSGTWRFDNVAVSDTSLQAPSVCAAGLGLAAVAIVVYRRRMAGTARRLCQTVPSAAADRLHAMLRSLESALGAADGSPRLQDLGSTIRGREREPRAQRASPRLMKPATSTDTTARRRGTAATECPPSSQRPEGSAATRPRSEAHTAR